MTNPTPSPSEESARERAHRQEFAHVVIRCVYCFADQPFWGDAEAAEAVAASFIKKHAACEVRLAQLAAIDAATTKGSSR